MVLIILQELEQGNMLLQTPPRRPSINIGYILTLPLRVNSLVFCMNIAGIIYRKKRKEQKAGVNQLISSLNNKPLVEFTYLMHFGAISKH